MDDDCQDFEEDESSSKETDMEEEQVVELQYTFAMLDANEETTMNWWI